MTVWKAEQQPSLNNLDGSIGRRPLLWLNVFCLDAPLVAISWQWLFARQMDFSLPVGDQAALFVTAWLIYLADRLADSLVLDVDVTKSFRQAFCFRHRKLFIAMTITIALFDTALVFSRLDRRIFVLGLFLGAIALIYLAINFVFPRLWQAIPLKEIAIGLLFTAGTLLVLGPGLFEITSTMNAAILFACLCSLNCMSIAVWERDLDWVQKKYSIATRCSCSDLFVPVLLIVLFAISLVFAFVDPGLRSIALCLGVGAILLAVLHIAPAARDERTALADLVLLTPLAVFVAGKIL
jgi:hypothetical protein